MGQDERSLLDEDPTRTLAALRKTDINKARQNHSQNLT